MKKELLETKEQGEINRALKLALDDKKWKNHKIGAAYTMDNKPALWKIAYYPILENPKTGEKYHRDPRALVETPIKNNNGDNIGTDFREIPLHYLTPAHNNI